MCLRAFVIRRLPTLPRSYPRSTIGSRGLNGRVRDGNGCDPSDTVTGNSKRRLGGGSDSRPRKPGALRVEYWSVSGD